MIKKMIREIDIMIKKQEEEIRNLIRERRQMEFKLELRDSYISVTQKSIERLNELKGLIEENSSNQVTGIMNDVGCMNIDKNRRTTVKAKLYGIEVEGTPEEISLLKAKLDKQTLEKVNQSIAQQLTTKAHQHSLFGSIKCGDPSDGWV